MYKRQVHWRFVEFSRIPKGGPWAKYGTNNPFVNPKVDLDLLERDRYMKHLIKLRDQAQKNRR